MHNDWQVTTSACRYCADETQFKMYCILRLKCCARILCIVFSAFYLMIKNKVEKDVLSVIVLKLYIDWDVDSLQRKVPEWFM